MTIADKPHGRARYNAGCRCGECRAANRDHARRRRAKHLQPVPPGDHQPAQLIDGPVTEAVRAQLVEAIIAQERPGLIAIAVRLAQLLDNDAATPQHSAAAHRLSEVLANLAKSSTKRGRLSLVRTMTGPTSQGKAK